MHFLNNKIPPPTVMLFFAWLMYLVADFYPTLLINAGLQFAIAICLALIGLTFGGLAVVAFKQHQTTVSPVKPASASSLVCTGVYQITRNPMYVGLVFLLLAWAVYLAAPVSTVGVVGFMVYMTYFQIKPEERALAQIFGEAYTDYRSSVRRWL